MSRSREAYEDFTSPLGIGFIVFGGYVGVGACEGASAMDGLDLARVTEMSERLEQMSEEIERRLEPLLSADGEHFSRRWGYLCRIGNDKSHLTRQIEKYADIYTSRVSNLMRYSPYMHFKGPKQTLAHDKGA